MARITWTQRQDIGPSARFGASIAFHPDRSRTVLFGGQAVDDMKGDTWEWDGLHWTQVQDSGPAPREGAAMAHGDAGIVLFGGEVKKAAALVRVGDTWSWDGEDWTQLADTGPMPRARASLVFDAAHSQYVLFGGSGSNTVFGDTWVFDGSDWTQVADTGPSPRIGHAMAYDASRERVVLFGGQNVGLANAETWTWDGADWTQVQDVGPSARSGHAMAGTSTAVWLFGGTPDLDGDGSGLCDDSWEWDGTDWTQRQDIGPTPRRDAGAAVDSARDRIVLFGGVATSGPPAGATALVGDTWEARVDDPEPNPVKPVAGEFRIDATEAMVGGSELGYVTVLAAAPAGVDRPIHVTVNGAAETVSSEPLLAGEMKGLAFFRMGPHLGGTLNIQVTLGSKTATATGTVVAGVPLVNFRITPVTVQRGSVMQVVVSDPALWSADHDLLIMSMDGEPVGIGPRGPATAVRTFSITIGPGVKGPGTRRLVAVSKDRPGTSVAGFVEVTVL